MKWFARRQSNKMPVSAMSKLRAIIFAGDIMMQVEREGCLNTFGIITKAEAEKLIRQSYQAGFLAGADYERKGD